MNAVTAASIEEDNLTDSFESSQGPVAHSLSKSLPNYESSLPKTAVTLRFKIKSPA